MSESSGDGTPKGVPYATGVPYERWLSRVGGPHLRPLARVFFGRLFENEMFSSSMAASASVTWLLAALATPGVMVSGSSLFFWGHMHTQPFEVQDSALLTQESFHIAFAMAMSGLVTMLVWGSMTPDRRDAQVLGHLPITTGEQARARLLALLTFFSLFIVAIAVPTGLAFTFVTVNPEKVLELPFRVMGHFLGVILGGGFIFFTLMSAQLVLAALFGPRAVKFVTLPLQLLAIAGMILAVSTMPRLSGMLTDGAMSPGVAWNPAAWFIGVYRWISGDHREMFTMLAQRGAIASIASIAIAMAVYPSAYGRCLQRVIDSEGRQTGKLSRFWTRAAAAALRPLLLGTLQRGLAAYTLATLARSQAHRFLIGSYLGLGMLLALPIAGRLLYSPITGPRQYAWFSVPLELTFWLVVGTRVAIMLPVEPAANWIFKLTEPVSKRRVLTTVVTVMAFVTCLPMAILFGGGAALAGSQTLGATVFVVVFLAGLCLIEGLTFTLRTVPFTCTYLPGQLRLRVFWPFYFVIWLNMSFYLADWGVWALGDVTRTAQLAGALVLLWLALRIAHLVHARRIRAFVYDEQEPTVLATMDLATSMRQT